MNTHDVEWQACGGRREPATHLYADRTSTARVVREGAPWGSADERETDQAQGLTPAQQSLALEGALLMVGHRWKPTVLYSLCAGPQRRRALERRMPHGVSANVLTKQLRALEEDGLILRIDNTDEGHGRHVTYALSALGESLKPTIAAFAAWSFANAALVRARERAARAVARDPFGVGDR